MSEQIWYKDVAGFLHPSRLPYFFPTPTMTLAEKLNAALRFSLYFAVVVSLVQRNATAFFVPAFIAIFTYALYAFYEHNKHEERSSARHNGTAYEVVQGKQCILPSKNNPMGNVLVSDYVLNPQRPPACSITRHAIKARAERIMNSLYKDVDDIWSARTSTRSFYQTPIQTIPNNQTEFAEWCYKPPKKTCKEGAGSVCYNNMYRDIKQ